MGFLSKLFGKKTKQEKQEQTDIDIEKYKTTQNYQALLPLLTNHKYREEAAQALDVLLVNNPEVLLNAAVGYREKANVEIIKAWQKTWVEYDAFVALWTLRHFAEWEKVLRSCVYRKDGPFKQDYLGATVMAKVAIEVAKLHAQKAVAMAGMVRDEPFSFTEQQADDILNECKKVSELLNEVVASDADPLVKEDALSALDYFASHNIGVEETNRRKITHLLILLEEKPLDSQSFFIKQLTDSLISDGKSYSSYMTENTKIVLKIVGKRNFDDENILLSEAFSVWGKPITSYQKFSGRGGNGVVGEIWQ